MQGIVFMRYFVFYALTRLSAERYAVGFGRVVSTAARCVKVVMAKKLIAELQSVTCHGPM